MRTLLLLLGVIALAGVIGTWPVTLGALAGAFLAMLEAQRRGQDPGRVWSAFLVVVLLGIIGARAYHILSDLAQGDPLGYLAAPSMMLNLRAGGRGIYGGIAGGLIGTYVYTRYARLQFWEWVDIAVPGLTLAQAIGRWSNFFNQELYGWPTNLPWGIPIDQAHRLAQFSSLPESTRFHPTFLYESLAMFAVTGLLLFISRRYSKKLKAGDMFLLYGMLYPLVRFFTEMERPDAWLISGVPAAQIIAMVSFVVCGAWFAYRHTSPAPSSPAPRRVPRRRVSRQR
ncbi:MAG: prolipoprotein diacylglyceryl transferase [Rudaea sp.]